MKTNKFFFGVAVVVFAVIFAVFVFFGGFNAVRARFGMINVGVKLVASLNHRAVGVADLRVPKGAVMVRPNIHKQVEVLHDNEVGIQHVVRDVKVVV